MCSIGMTCGCGGSHRNLSKYPNPAIDGRRGKRLAFCLLKLQACRMGAIKSICTVLPMAVGSHLPLNSGRFVFCSSSVFQCTLSSTPIADVIQSRADKPVAPSSPRTRKKYSLEDLDELEYCIIYWRWSG